MGIKGPPDETHIFVINGNPIVTGWGVRKMDFQREPDIIWSKGHNIFAGGDKAGGRGPKGWVYDRKKVAVAVGMVVTIILAPLLFASVFESQEKVEEKAPKVLEYKKLDADPKVKNDFERIANILKEHGVQNIFAPVEILIGQSGKSDEIFWYADPDGDIKRYSELDRVEQEKVKEVIARTAQSVDRICNNLLQSSIAKERKDGEILRQIIGPPDETWFYTANGKPLVTGWGVRNCGLKYGKDIIWPEGHNIDEPVVIRLSHIEPTTIQLAGIPSDQKFDWSVQILGNAPREVIKNKDKFVFFTSPSNRISTVYLRLVPLPAEVYTVEVNATNTKESKTFVLHIGRMR
ncbi:hypothetical protein N9174_02135 [bacterium]|nr:hypothetical protein [bacterium]